MGTSAFQQGTVVEIDGKAAVLYRKVSESMWQLEDARTKRIFEHSVEQLRGLYVAGQLRFIDADRPASEVKSPGIQRAKDKEIEAAKIRRLYANAVADLPSTEAAFSPAILETWKSLRAPELPPHWTTVFRWKKRYLHAGRDMLALLDNTKAKGNRASRYPADAVILVEKAINECYLTPERRTVSDTLDVAVSLVMRENRLRPETAQLPLPTLRHLTTMIEAIPAFDRYAARHGRTAAAKRFRAVLAHRTTQAPLERAEIDHTPLDLMVIDDDSGLPLGRPYLTICLDDYTRCVLGLYISFEPPSHFTVSRCLKMAFLPKTELLNQYPAIQNAWDAHGVMRDLVVDNGQEFHSTSLENVCYSLGIEIHYSARKTPWFKGKIERFQGTLNRAIAHGTPGTTFSNIFDKEDYDPSKQAILRYYSLEETARMTGLDPLVVADALHQGLISSVERDGRRRVPAVSVEQFNAEYVVLRAVASSLGVNVVQLANVGHKAGIPLVELRRTNGGSQPVLARSDEPALTAAWHAEAG